MVLVLLLLVSFCFIAVEGVGVGAVSGLPPERGEGVVNDDGPDIEEGIIEGLVKTVL